MWLLFISLPILTGIEGFPDLKPRWRHLTFSIISSLTNPKTKNQILYKLSEVADSEDDEEKSLCHSNSTFAVQASRICQGVIVDKCKIYKTLQPLHWLIPFFLETEGRNRLFKRVISEKCIQYNGPMDIQSRLWQFYTEHQLCWNTAR